MIREYFVIKYFKFPPDVYHVFFTTVSFYYIFYDVLFYYGVLLPLGYHPIKLHG